LHYRFEKRQQFLQARQLLFVDQDVGVFHLNPHLVGVGNEVGRDVAAVELHALDHVSSVSSDFASSTVITPSLPTFCIAFARKSPISRSPLG
jgi:hypothetical protein